MKAGLGPSYAIYFVVIFKWPFQIPPINEIYSTYTVSLIEVKNFIFALKVEYVLNSLCWKL